MNRRQRAKTVTGLEPGQDTAPASGTSSASPQLDGPDGPRGPEPLYGVALLKMAFELKRRRDGTPDEILRHVIARMRLPEAEFRRWLSQQGELGKVFSGEP